MPLLSTRKLPNPLFWMPRITGGPLLTGGWVGAIVVVGVRLGMMVRVGLGVRVCVGTGVAVDSLIRIGLLAVGAPELILTAPRRVKAQAVRDRAKITNNTLRRAILL